MIDYDDVLRHLPVVFLGATVPVLTAVYFFLPVSTAVRALFLLVGVLVSVPAFYLTTSRPRSSTTPIAHTTYAKVLTLLASLSICATVLLYSRVVPLILFLFAGYLILTYQLSRSAPPAVVLYESLLLFVVPLLAKHLTTGLYFGDRDILTHIWAVETLLAANYVSEMPTDYVHYPIFHLLVGGVSTLFKLPTYDALVLTGAVVYGLLVPIVYLIADGIFENRTTALSAAVGFTVLMIPSYYVFNFFPQALAVALLFIGFHFVARLFRAQTRQQARRYTVLIVFLTVLMAMTHHLTYVLFALPFGVALILVFAQAVLDARFQVSEITLPRSARYLYIFPILLSTFILFSYWLYTPSIFLLRITRGVLEFLAITAEGGFSSEQYGLDPFDPGMWDAVRWLLSPTGLYFSFTAGILGVGVYETLQNLDRYWTWLPLLGTGFLFSTVLLPLPIPLPWIERFRLIVCIFVVFALGVGIARTCRANPTYGRYAVVAIVLVAAMGTTGTFTKQVASDVEYLHADDRDTELQFDEQEYRMMQETSVFLEEHRSTPVHSEWVANQTLRSEGTPLTGTVTVTDDGIEAPAGLLLIRDSWTEYTQPASGMFIVSSPRYEAVKESNHKVYTNGEMHLLWSDQDYEGVFGDDAENEVETRETVWLSGIQNQRS